MPIANAIVPESNFLTERAVGAYLGLATGDALGATVEFLTVREIISRYREHRDIIGGGWLRLKPGQVTDDTTMALALGESILSSMQINSFEIAEAFSDWMKAKPIDIGNTVRRGIVNFRYSDEPCVEKSEADAGNGACMRCLPIALATYSKDAGFVNSASQAQAHITHNNPLSDAGTECVIHAIQDLISGASKKEILEGPVRRLVEQYPEFNFDSKRMTNPSGYIVDTLKAVFQSFFIQDSFEGVLIDVVNRGGDADTTGAIAGMLAGACYGEEQIPRRWLKKLDKNVSKLCKSQAVELILRARNICANTELIDKRTK